MISGSGRGKGLCVNTALYIGKSIANKTTKETNYDGVMDYMLSAAVGKEIDKYIYAYVSFTASRTFGEGFQLSPSFGFKFDLPLGSK